MDDVSVVQTLKCWANIKKQEGISMFKKIQFFKHRHRHHWFNMQKLLLYIKLVVIE